jgi:glucose-6-phosphate isomerase, archaeal
MYVHMQLPTFSGPSLTGPHVVTSRKKVVDLQGVFLNDVARAAFAPEAIAYEVQMHAAVPDNTEGGLFFGISHLNPGTVDNEFFMTRGHYHSKSDRGEYYWGIEGFGLLLLMTRDRAYRTEEVRPGSLHYIPGHTAHRLINTGPVRLSVGACWPSDAGHDYDSIARDGFSARVFSRNGQVVIEASK